MKKRTYSQQYCIKRAGLLLQRARALSPGCRIGIAVSGGVDSMTLLKVMQIRQGILPFKVELMALHLNPGFAPQDHAALSAWLAAQGIASHIEITDFGGRAHSPENRKNSPCFYCAWLRRKRLFDLCRQYALTHLAFGHNADDMATTFMLNLLRNGRVAALEPDQAFFGGKLRVIRPFLLVEKKYIRQAARQWQLPVWQNACPSSGHSGRSEMEEVLAAIGGLLPGSQRSLLNGLMRWQLHAAECGPAGSAS